MYDSQVFISNKSIAFRMTFENSVNETSLGWVFLVGPLIVLESCRTTLSFDAFVHIWCARRTFWAAARCGSRSATSCCSTTKTCSLHLCSFQVFHFGNHLLIILEVGSIKRLQSWNPNAKLGSEKFVFSLVFEHWVARILHQVQML